LRVFLDVKADYWGPFPTELKDRVADTPYFIVLLTHGCLSSPWMVLEISEAFRSRRHILVIREDDFVLPDEQAIDPSIRGLLFLNHLTYTHDFSDEVIRRVLAMVQKKGVALEPSTRRSEVIWTSSGLLLVAAIGALVWGRYRAANVGLVQRTATDMKSVVAEPRSSAKPPTAALIPALQPAPVQPATGAHAARVPDDPVRPQPEPRHPLDAPAPSEALMPPSRAPLTKSNETPHPRTTPAPSREADRCEPNFYFDDYGEKRFKPECFLTPHEGGQNANRRR
jgi:hypothetical protein